MAVRVENGIFGKQLAFSPSGWTKKQPVTLDRL